MRHPSTLWTASIVVAGLSIAGIGVGAQGASAAVSPTQPVVINEVYGGGGNSGGLYNRDFIELRNVSMSPVDVTGWAVQYGAATNTLFPGLTILSGTIAPGASYLVAEAFGANTALPELPTADAMGTIAISGTTGKVALTSSSTPLVCSSSISCTSSADVVDLVGWGSSVVYAGTVAPPTTNSTSVARSASGANTADNGADFTAGAPTPTSGPPVGPTDPVDATIAEIQGTGASSPLVGTTVRTTGVVTAAYPTGGINGYVIQTGGSGGEADATPGASDAVFVFSSATAGQVAVGDTVQVTGPVSEFGGLTEITVADQSGLVKLPAGAPVTVTSGTWPAADAGREALESVLYQPTGDLTITDTFSTNQFGVVGLAAGTRPLLQPTEVGRPGSPEAAAAIADNAARKVVLDDGSSINFLSAANTGLAPTYVSVTNPVRVGAAATITAPVILDFRNNVWTLNPTAPGPASATFENDRTAAPEPVGGDLRVASFNVLNYFTTLGAGTAGCTSFNDRTGDPVTVNSGCAPRGAWDPDDLKRQQDKIVAAINDLDADVVGLLEIENSAVVDGVADEALSTLVNALNAAAGSDVWAYVPSSAELPPVALMDVITNAIIYRPAAVERIGDSRALGDQSADADGAFGNAREPIAQVFTPTGGGEPFLVVVNHFKSKGSAGPWPGDADTGDGQGASNESRVRQAVALRDWVPTIQGDAASVALVGDFNSYTLEDPLQVLYDVGYTDAAAALAPGQYSYSFSGLSGSLDHVLLNPAAMERATGADIWEINAEESIALEYDRYNYHGTLFYASDEYRSSDHDPVIVGLSAGASASATTLSASPATQVYGASSPRVLLTATVSADEPVSGVVEFVADGSVIGTGTLTSGTATYRLPASTPAGTYEIVARWAGTAGVEGSTSAPVTVTVAQATTKTTLSALAGGRFLPTYVFVSVTQDNGRAATGTVDIREGDVVLKSLPVRLGLAVGTLPSLARGSHVLTAVFDPSDDSVAPSTSTPLTIKVR